MIPGASPIIAGSVFNPQGVNFNGSTYFRNSSGFSNISDGPYGTCSFWVKPHAGSLSDQQTIFNSGANGGSVRFQVIIQTAGFNKFSFTGQSPGGSNFLAAISTSVAVEGVWQYVISSWKIDNTGSPTWVVYLNDVLNASQPSAINGSIDYTQGRWQLGADTFDNSRFLDSDIAELFFLPQYLDLSVTANRRKFITASGAPANLAADGSAPFGAVPTIYLSGDASNFATNRGNGGALTLIAGGLSTATTRPHL